MQEENLYFWEIELVIFPKIRKSQIFNLLEIII